MQIKRRKTKTIKIGNVCIGGNHPIAIQSMTKTKTADIEETSKQLEELESAGCELVRLAVRDIEDARALKKLKKNSKVPLIADIHFNWRLAIEAIDSGVDKIRLNPGNIYRLEQLREITRAAKLNHIPIRVGVNSGSLLKPKTPNARHKTISDLMVESALDYIKILEGFKFYNIVVSLKGSNIFDTLDAYRKISRVCDYPLHLGVTATGPSYSGAIKSSIAVGVLLLEGIGDTLRISLTDKPQAEVRAAQSILEALGLRNFGPEIISCPTCGRCEVDLVKIVNDLDNLLTGKLANWQTGKPLKVAIMGCVVNGPGEVGQADLGVAFGKKEGLLFKDSKPLRKISADKCVDTLLEEVRQNVLVKGVYTHTKRNTPRGRIN